MSEQNSPSTPRRRDPSREGHREPSRASAGNPTSEQDFVGIRPAGLKMAAAAANRLSAYFPRSAASDPETFSAGLVELLAGYPEWVLVEMVSVRTGLPARQTFMPSIAEI